MKNDKVSIIIIEDMERSVWHTSLGNLTDDILDIRDEHGEALVQIKCGENKTELYLGSHDLELELDTFIKSL